MNEELTIIGSGPGGYVAAILASKKGLDVKVVEKGNIGGVCTNEGCIPSKALLSVAEKIGSIENARRDGIDVELKNIDFDKVMTKKERAVKMSRKAIQNLFEKHGVEVLKGKAKVRSSTEVEVEKEDETEVIGSDHIIIATGSEPISLPGLEIDEENILSSSGALGLEDLPESLLIVGGGYIGIEMAYIFSSLGTDVKIIELEDRLLPLMDKDLSEVAERMMKRNKVKFYTGSKVTKVDESAESLEVKIEGDTEKKVEVEKVLCSVGRRPTPPEADIDIIGEDGGIQVDESMRTEVENVYAIGDVNGESMLAHAAFKQAEIAVDNILDKDTEDFSQAEIPAGLYTHPEMAGVGLTESEAEEKMDRVKVGKFPISGTGRGSSTGERMGLAKVIANADDEIVGLHLACPGATDIIMEGTLAVEKSMDVEELAEMVHSHPTYSEAIKEAAENVCGESVHTG